MSIYTFSEETCIGVFAALCDEKLLFYKSKLYLFPTLIFRDSLQLPHIANVPCMQVCLMPKQGILELRGVAEQREICVGLSLSG